MKRSENRGNEEVAAEKEAQKVISNEGVDSTDISNNQVTLESLNLVKQDSIEQS
jgi:hypothetical protein